MFKHFVAEQLGVQPAEYTAKRVDFETVFGLMESALIGHHGLLKEMGERPSGPTGVDVLEQQFHLVLCGTLLAATRTVNCAHHQRLVQWLDAGDIVLSFNYDLLIDRALKATGSWWPDDGYRLAFHRLGARDGDDAVWRNANDVHSSVALLKLHGSLNWLYPRTPYESIYHLNLYGAELPSARDVVYCLDDLHPRFEDDYPLYEWWARYEHHDDHVAYDLHSLIVPPTIAKPYQNFESVIGPLWAKALKALLTEAEELYLIGYSLRRDDLRSWWLFRKAAVESQLLRYVGIVDPSDDVVARATIAFEGREVRHVARTLEEFVGAL